MAWPVFGRVAVADAATGAFVAWCGEDDGTWVGVDFGPGGDQVLSVWGVVAVFDLTKTGAHRDAPRAAGPALGAEDVSDAVFGSDGRQVLTAGRGRAEVWDLATGRPVLSVRGRGNDGAPAVAYSPDGRRVAVGWGAVGDRNGETTIWEVGSGGRK